MGLTLISKPPLPKTKKIAQEASAGSGSTLIGVEHEVIDKDSEDFLEYRLELKQYVTDKSKYNDKIQKCFSMIIGQCNPAVMHNLEAEESFADIKEK